MAKPEKQACGIHKAAVRIWDIAVDSWGLNVELRDDGVIVYQSAWEREFIERVERQLGMLLQEEDDGEDVSDVQAGHTKVALYDTSHECRA